VLKYPDDIKNIIKRKYKNNRREWLKMSVSDNNSQSLLPMEINLDIPTEKDALIQQDGVKAWIKAWKSWHSRNAQQGGGILSWTERHWRSLGVQTVPQKLILNEPAEAVSWIGEVEVWSRAVKRYKTLIQRWSALIDVLPKYYDVLANYDDENFLRISKCYRGYAPIPIQDYIHDKYLLSVLTVNGLNPVKVSSVNWLQRFKEPASAIFLKFAV